MPVPVKELKEFQRPLEDRILEFLESHPDKGFSLFEVVIACEGYADNLLMALALTYNEALVNQYKLALAGLQLGGHVDSATVRGTPYYAARR